jgi:hypothetical protein
MRQIHVTVENKDLVLLIDKILGKSLGQVVGLMVVAFDQLSVQKVEIQDLVVD